MNECVFYTTRYKKDLLEKLEELREENELINTFDIAQDGNIYRMSYTVNQNEPDIIEVFAHIASDIVQKQGIFQVAEDYLKERKDLGIIDRREIQRRFVTNNYLPRQEGFSALSYYLIYLPLLDNLKQCHEINLDGWLKFRTYKYKIVLEDILEQFVEDYLIKKGIVKVIKMIREISQQSDSLEDTLHLVYLKNGEVSILNELMEEVTASYMNEYCKELFADSTLNKEDLIMNILIAVCPRRIIVHQKERARHPQFIKTLEGIFGMNIKYCSGCIYCTN